LGEGDGAVVAELLGEHVARTRSFSEGVGHGWIVGGGEFS
jgi:hypothetical protein